MSSDIDFDGLIADGSTRSEPIHLGAKLLTLVALHTAVSEAVYGNSSPTHIRLHWCRRSEIARILQYDRQTRITKEAHDYARYWFFGAEIIFTDEVGINEIHIVTIGRLCDNRSTFLKAIE